MQRLDYKSVISSKKIISSVLLTILVIFSVVNVSAAPADAPAGSTAEQRIAQRTKEQNVKLDEKETKRISSKCSDVQNKIRSIQNEFGSVSKNRSEVYQRIEGKVLVAIGQLKIAGKDTFKLEQQRDEYVKKVDTLENTMNQYKQTIDDIVVMNCQANPVGFMAMLKTAREYHASIRQQFADLNKYLVDTIKATLTSHVNDLQPKTQTEGN